MLRVRFHGRGGHGIKTASRILGAAAFLSGYQAQDSPVYGAERRGTALSAFTRIDHEPIRERGVVTDPDLILIGDETLLADPLAGALIGAGGAAIVFVNSILDGSQVAREHKLRCPVVTLDLAKLTSEILGRASAMSAPLGAAACALTGLVSEELMEQAVREELADLHLSGSVINKNVDLARHVYEALPSATIPDRPLVVGGGPIEPARRFSNQEWRPRRRSESILNYPIAQSS
jgi:pyruvate ferredoxin oxidoreductase gamma subunit